MIRILAGRERKADILSRGAGVWPDLGCVAESGRVARDRGETDQNQTRLKSHRFI